MSTQTKKVHTHVHIRGNNGKSTYFGAMPAEHHAAKAIREMTRENFSEKIDEIKEIINKSSNREAKKTENPEIIKLYLKGLAYANLFVEVSSINVNK